jgi:hypothetical protein
MSPQEIVADHARPDERVDVQVDDLGRHIEVDGLARYPERARPGIRIDWQGRFGWHEAAIVEDRASARKGAVKPLMAGASCH